MDQETLTLPAVLDVFGPHEAGPRLSVIIPTRNERDNIAPLLDRLRHVLSDLEWEAIFVDDDSTDGTVAAIRAQAQADRRVRLVHRIGRRGLSSACIEAAQSSSAPLLAVMDADLQHDETLLPRMVQAFEDPTLDLVVGSRYVAGGGTDDWDAKRVRISDIATRLGKWALRIDLADPMSGFFMLRREAFDASVRRLSALGFKILIDLLASSPRKLKVLELPYHFRARVAGESKLDAQVAWQYIMLLADKTLGRFMPVRFVFYSGVGSFGLVLHVAVLRICYHVFGISFTNSQNIATGFAMVSNFLLNNLLTYSDRRLEGWALLRGFVTFSVVCSIAWVANIATASYLYNPEGDSWSWVGAGVAGALVSAVWNYAVSSVIVWKRD